tara:strand:- start:44 stop:637 length:594 start_codon:yes stop_codon:yes gene_type:complete
MSHSLFALLTGTSFVFDAYWNSETKPAVVISEDGAFLSTWDWDAQVPECKFYNGSYEYSNGLCSHFAIARMGAHTQIEATERALACAAHFETDCILSAEIGLAVPAAFVYDQEEGLRMLIAPKMLPLVDNHNTTEKRIGVQNPGSPMREQVYNDTVRVQYLRGGTRVMETNVLTGSSAYCTQLLRSAFDSACWKEID